MSARHSGQNMTRNMYRVSPQDTATKGKVVATVN